MKKLLLATAVATLSVSAAQAAPTVYGKAFLTADYFSGGDVDKKTTTRVYTTPTAYTQSSTVDKVDGGSTTSLNSNLSRIGLKGAEALTANTDVVYQLEYGINVDDNKGGTKNGKSQDQFYSRDTYLGLSNKNYGTLVAGHLSAIDDNINYVGQTVGQFDNSFGGAVWDGNRVSNAFAYFSPNYNGAQFMAMYGIDGDEDLNGLKDGGWGVGVKYEPAAQPFRAGATYIQSGDFKTMRISGDYKINPVIGVGALYQASDIDVKGAETENVLSLSGTYKTATPWTAYAQADMIKNVGFYDGDDSTQFVVGGKYAFNPATTGHIYAGYRNNDVADTVIDSRVNGVGTVSTTTTDSSNGFGVGAGIEYKF